MNNFFHPLSLHQENNWIITNQMFCLLTNILSQKTVSDNYSVGSDKSENTHPTACIEKLSTKFIVPTIAVNL